MIYTVFLVHPENHGQCPWFKKGYTYEQKKINLQSKMGAGLPTKSPKNRGGISC